MADFGVGSWPYRRARINPQRTAFQQGDRARTYQELAERVDALANGLIAEGVRQGDRVAYLGVNDILEFEALFATWRLGAIFVPLNYRLAAPELAFMLEDCAPVALFFDAEQAGVAADLRHAVPHVRSWLSLADGDIDRLIDVGRELPPLDVDVALADDAVILYTSGTTGRPKGAVLTHANLTFNTMNQLAHADVLGSDTALCMAPLFHATGLGQVSLPTLFKGGRVIVAPRFEPGAVLAAVSEYRIASFSAVPTMLQMLCDHPDFEAADLSSLRYVIYGGSSVAERVAVAWQGRGIVLLQGYGMTEASPGVTLAVADGAVDRPVSIGMPHFFTDVTLAPLPGAESSDYGELLTRGLNVFRGYWNRPAETARALAGGWFHSGDVVRIDDDGWAYVIDRIKDVIISGGENIYPAEVEAQLNALPGVAESAVIAAADERWGEVGLAYVVLAGGSEWTDEDIRGALAGKLAAFKIPKHVRFVEQLPKTATGKIRKEQLRSAHTSEGDPHEHGR
jgi:fatty-acyl-CoA synthase